MGSAHHTTQPAGRRGRAGLLATALGPVDQAIFCAEEKPVVGLKLIALRDAVPETILQAPRNRDDANALGCEDDAPAAEILMVNNQAYSDLGKIISANLSTEGVLFDACIRKASGDDLLIQRPFDAGQ